jgi:hypothetical protein
VKLHHAAVTHIDGAEAAEINDWIAAGATAPARLLAATTAPIPAPLWLHMSADDGLVTGRYDTTRGWLLAVTGHGAGTPALGYEIRLFTRDWEILLRRNPYRNWSGRSLCDTHPLAGRGEDTRPLDRRLLLGGERAEQLDDGFCRVHAPGGRTHILPVAWYPPDHTGRGGTVLLVRDYLAEDTTTGQLRIAASRCVDYSNGWATAPGDQGTAP